MENAKSLKKRKFYECQNCDFKTCNYSDYIRHLSTRKHKVSVGGTQEEIEGKPKKTTKLFCDCICGNKYSTYSGRWKHYQKCQLYKDTIEQSTLTMITNEENTSKNEDPQSEMSTLTSLVMTLIQQNKDLTQQVIELSNKPNNVNNGTINNNKFNLNVFLNETCKDAMNMSDFIESLEISIKDLEETGRLGYASGISRIFINGLKSLDIHTRPIHCSDAKREVLYIKDNNKWFKEDEDKQHITLTIKQIAHKNMIQINKWQQLHPEFNNPESKQNDKYQKILYNSMSGLSNEEAANNYCKIIRNLAKEVTIDK